jgi:hypothetical protein
MYVKLFSRIFSRRGSFFQNHQTATFDTPSRIDYYFAKEEATLTRAEQ